jgi:hypothetical protein
MTPQMNDDEVDVMRLLAVIRHRAEINQAMHARAPP